MREHRMAPKAADSAQTICPGDHQLSELLEAGSTDTTDVALHVETCVLCQQTLESLTGDAKFCLPKPQVPDYLSTFASQLSGLTELTVDDFPVVSLPGFEVLECVGRGGTGAVYRACHEQLDREVAVKVIAAGVHAGPEYHERLDREGKLIAKLDHPHIVRIFDSGQHNGLPYLVLEFMDGGSLAERRSHLTDSQQIARLIEILARALSAAHSAGIVHRDLKPANVLLALADAGDEAIDIEGQLFIPRIADFGLSKQFQQQNVSQSTGILGTPGYMAPEQANEARGEIGPATDIHALGIMLYELLTGRRPFDGRTTLATVENVRSNQPAPIRAHRSDVPTELADICRQCLQKQPSARYQSALELADELHRFQSGQALRCTRRIGHGKGRNRRFFIAATVVSAAILLAVIRVETDRGMIVIDADESVEIEIRRNGQSFDSFKVKDSDNTRSVYSGDVEIAIPSKAADRYTVSNSQFQMTRGGREVVTIRKIASSSGTSPRDGTTLSAPAFGASEREIVTWFVSNGGYIRVPSQRLGVRSVEDIPDGELKVDYLLDEKGFLRGEHLPLIASLPHLRRLQIFNAEQLGDHLAALNAIEDLQSLSLGNCDVDDRQWAAFDNYKNLKWLALHGTQVSNSFIPKLKQCEKLHELELNEQQILHPQGLQFLKSVRSLKVLGLHDFTDATATAIAELPQLTSIRLHDGRGMSQATIDAICNCKQLIRLKFWRTDLNGIDLSELGALENLIWVELMNVNLSPDDVVKIAHLIPNADLMQCTERDIESLVTEAGGTLQMRRKGFRKTKHPTIYGVMEIDSITFKNALLLRDDHFVPYQHLKHLLSLTINQAGINGSTLNHISHLTSLEHLSLAGTQVSDRNTGFLRTLTGLKSLNLKNTPITAYGVASIEPLRNLESLSLDGLQITPETVQLLASFPGLRELHLEQASDSTIDLISALQQLEFLSIEQSYTVTGKSITGISALKNLKTLVLGDTNMPLDAIQSLREALLHCTITESHASSPQKTVSRD